MTFPPARDLDSVAAALESLRALEADAVADAVADAEADKPGEAEGHPGADWGTGADERPRAPMLSEAQLLVRSLAALGAVRAAVEAVALRRIAALDRACAIDAENDPVRASGHRDIGSLLAELWRISLPAARQLCAVARATSPRLTLHGEDLPAEFPHLEAALLGIPLDPATVEDSAEADRGDHPASDDTASPRVSVEQAAAIIRELEKTGPGCGLEQRTMGERVLVEHAPGLTVEQVRRLAVQVRDRLDQDGIEPREEVLRRRRSLVITTTRDGMTHINWYLDAESAGHVLPQITAYVSQDFRDTRDPRDTRDEQRTSSTRLDAADAGGHPEAPHAGVRFEPSASPASTDSDESTSDVSGPEMPEHRSLAQLRSDGAVEAFRHRAGCTHQTTSPPVTMIVRVALADLRSGTGIAEIDGIPTPVSAGTARRLSADADLIPMVLGRDSEVLDLGRTKRLFNPAQKHALAERDGGCAWTGCPHPPAYTQAHHIRWWDRDTGPTDLKNGILLCSNHHHRVHDDGWQISVRENVPWFTPPAHHDPTRTPRRGGRIRVPDSASP